MQENKFKVGDKVKYIGTPIYDYLKTGDVRVVTDFQKYEGSDEMYGVNLEGVTGWVCPKSLRLVGCCDSFTVEQVIKEFINVCQIGREVVNVEEVIHKTKEELEKRKNPEYLKYLELKEKFG